MSILQETIDYFNLQVDYCVDFGCLRRQCPTNIDCRDCWIMTLEQIYKEGIKHANTKTCLDCKFYLSTDCKKLMKFNPQYICEDFKLKE